MKLIDIGKGKKRDEYRGLNFPSMDEKAAKAMGRSLIGTGEKGMRGLYDPGRPLKVLWYHKDFKHQAKAQKRVWEKETPRPQIVMHELAGKDLARRTLDLLETTGRPISEWQIMTHSEPDWMNMGDGGIKAKKVEDLFNSSRLQFTQNALVHIKSCRAGEKAPDGSMNIQEAFSRALPGVNVDAYEDRIKYEYNHPALAVGEGYFAGETNESNRPTKSGWYVFFDQPAKKKRMKTEKGRNSNKGNHLHKPYDQNLKK